MDNDSFNQLIDYVVLAFDNKKIMNTVHDVNKINSVEDKFHRNILTVMHDYLDENGWDIELCKKKIKKGQDDLNGWRDTHRY